MCQMSELGAIRKGVHTMKPQYALAHLLVANGCIQSHRGTRLVPDIISYVQTTVHIAPTNTVNARDSADHGFIGRTPATHTQLHTNLYRLFHHEVGRCSTRACDTGNRI